MVCPIIGRP